MPTLLLMLLAQPSGPASSPQVPIAIVVSSRRDASNTHSSAVCARLRAALAAEGIVAMTEEESAARLGRVGAIDPRACDGSRLCLSKLADLLRGIVIGVDIGTVRKLSAAHLEAVAIGRAESLAVADFTASSAKVDFEAQSAAELQRFARALAAAIKASSPQPPDAPVASALTPAVSTEAPVEVAAPVGRRSRVPGVAGVSVSAAVGIASGVFLGLALREKRSFDSSLSHPSETITTSRLSRPELDQLAAGANRDFSIALGLGITAAVGVAVSVVFLVLQSGAQ